MQIERVKHQLHKFVLHRFLLLHEMLELIKKVIETSVLTQFFFFHDHTSVNLQY